MWRAFFVAMGIAFCILGAECLVIEKATWAKSSDSAESDVPVPGVPSKRELEPPEWAPWSLISVGAVTLIYSFTIPRRVAS